MTERRRQPEQTRARLVDAAARSFSERGYAVTTVQQICALACVSVGAFYYHFRKAGIPSASWNASRPVSRALGAMISAPSTRSRRARTTSWASARSSRMRAAPRSTHVRGRSYRGRSRGNRLLAVKRSRQAPRSAGSCSTDSGPGPARPAREAIAGVPDQGPVARAIAKINIAVARGGRTLSRPLPKSASNSMPLRDR